MKWSQKKVKSEDEVESEERRCNSAKVRRKKIHPRQMLEKSRNAVFFQWFVCRVSRKVGSLKRRVRSHVVRGDIKNCTPLWREAHFEVKILKNWGVRSTFWSWDVQKLHAAVARSTFWSQNAKKWGSLTMSKNCAPLWREVHFEVKMVKNWGVRSTFWSWDFWKFRCRKIARRCGEKHIRKSKCTKYLCFAAFFKFRCRKISQVVS